MICRSTCSCRRPSTLVCSTASAERTSDSCTRLVDVTRPGRRHRPWRCRPTWSDREVRGTQVAGARRPWLAAAAGTVSASAAGGAIGFVGGGIDMGDTIMRLPLDSPVLSRVGLPPSKGSGDRLAFVAGDAWRRSPHTDRLAIVAGGLLVAWLVVQLAFIRSLSSSTPSTGRSERRSCGWGGGRPSCGRWRARRCRGSWR